jgi:hypothetical protein
MSARRWILLGLVLGFVSAGALSVRAFDDIKKGDVVGTAVGDIYMDGNSLCMGADATGHCLGQSGTTYEHAYGPDVRMTMSSAGGVSMTSTLNVTGVTSLALLDTSDGATLGAEVVMVGPLGTPSGDLVIDTAGAIDSRDIYQGGDGTYSWSACAAAGSLCTEGNLEVDSAARLDNTLAVGGISTLTRTGIWGASASILLGLGTASSTPFMRISPYTDDGLHFSIDGTDNRTNHNFIITALANYNKNHDHSTLSANPTLILQSALDPDVDNTRWGSVYHDGTSAAAGALNITTGAGDIVLNPTVGVDLRTDGGPVQLGDGTYSWGHSPTGLGVEGSMEVDGPVFLDGNLTLGGSATLALNGMYMYTPSNQFVLALHDTSANYALVVTAYGNRAQNHGHSAQTNPTLYGHSAANPTVGVGGDQWWSLVHDGTTDTAGTATFATGAGGITLDPASSASPILLDGVVQVANRTRYIDIEAGAAFVGATAPTATTTGTARCLGFDADNEVAHLSWEVPSDWVSGTSAYLKIYWHAESGDAIADTEDVQWMATYRSIDHTAHEPIDNGSVTTNTVSYTGSDAGTDKGTFEHEIEIVHNDGDNPITVGEVLYFQFDRDVSGESNSYSGLALVCRWEIKMTSNGLAEH